MDSWNARRWKEVYLSGAVRYPRNRIVKLQVVLVALTCLSAVINLATMVWLCSRTEQPSPVQLTIEHPAFVSPTPSPTPTVSFDPDCVECEPHGLPIIPVQGESVKITCRFHDADRPGHSGVDFSVEAKTEVMATMDGLVTFAGEEPMYGWLVIVQNEAWESWYAHNAYLLVRQGDLVQRGEVIALSGSTGASSAPHLHYGVKDLDAGWLDPENTLGGQIMQVVFTECVLGVR